MPSEKDKEIIKKAQDLLSSGGNKGSDSVYILKVSGVIKALEGVQQRSPDNEDVGGLIKDLENAIRPPKPGRPPMPTNSPPKPLQSPGTPKSARPEMPSRPPRPGRPPMPSSKPPRPPMPTSKPSKPPEGPTTPRSARPPVPGKAPRPPMPTSKPSKPELPSGIAKGIEALKSGVDTKKVDLPTDLGSVRKGKD